ncbi:hypothetical protein [Oceanithermus sp.]|uniref:hypothetical protein n=1 Tax=Oceanithermus sp. TaxID=2268145 RepID=UPI00257A7BD5|nr:hypothetical protein [Oceanithermus sp.]
MRQLIKRYELLLAALFSAFLLLMPYGLFLAPLFYTLVLVAIYLRNTSEQLKAIRVELLGYQNQMLKFAKDGVPAPLSAHHHPAEQVHPRVEVEGE